VIQAARPTTRDSQAEPAASSLDGLVAKRVTALTAYQNARYALRYRTLVERVAERAKAIEGGERLALAVARYYHKLLARKDEYEVARLYTDGSFRQQLEAEFEGDYRLVIHFAPPILRSLEAWFGRVDPHTGSTGKIAFGGWFLTCLAGIAKLKFLRDTPFDPFGWTAERRLERQLPRDYEARIEELLAGLGPDNLELAIEIASLPEHVRGFEHVRARHLEQARAQERELLEAFRRAAPTGPTD
jgi:indolepyruvate ferredoxin oxidoreductase